MASKCPSCEKMFSSVNMEEVKVRGTDTRTWHGVSYRCPMCQACLGVGIDPVALKTDTVSEILKALGKTQ